MKKKEQDALLQALKARFDRNMQRHAGMSWAEVLARIGDSPAALESLQEMERTGGEPDVIRKEAKTGRFVFCDCSAESPAGRRSACYDDEALQTRKENKPARSAVDMAASMGIDLLTEEEYRELQQSGEYDLKTSSWIKTPAEIRAVGGALFCDRRYGQVFVYHNGASSYYAARGFRGLLRV